MRATPARPRPYISRNRHAQDVRLNTPPREPDPLCNHDLHRSDHHDIGTFRYVPCEVDCDLGIVACAMCDGDGGVTLPPAGPFFREEWHECRKCKGTGKVARG